MKEYLNATKIIDWQNDHILQLAQKLATSDTETTTKACFEWVRDNIYHSSDRKMNPVTCKGVSEKMRGNLGTCGATPRYPQVYPLGRRKAQGNAHRWGLGDLGTWGIIISLSPYLPISLSPYLPISYSKFRSPPAKHQKYCSIKLGIALPKVIY